MERHKSANTAIGGNENTNADWKNCP